MKNTYLNDVDEVKFMQRRCGVSGLVKESECTNEGAGMIWTCIRRVTESKYSDILLICSVAAGFGALLIVSSIG